MKVMSLPAPAPIAPPIESIVDGDLLGALGRRALIEKRRREIGDAWLGGRILRAAGPDEEPEADGWLLVVRHRDHLQAIRQRPDLIRRKARLRARAAGAAAARSASRWT